MPHVEKGEPALPNHSFPFCLYSEYCYLLGAGASSRDTDVNDKHYASFGDRRKWRNKKVKYCTIRKAKGQGG